MSTIQKFCSSCGESFGCGVDSAEGCWCASLPQAFAEFDPRSDCLCPACLTAQVQKRESANAAIEGEDYYFEGGLLVMTAAYHIKRGSCCGNGCVWCPYEPRHEEGATKLASASASQ